MEPKDLDKMIAEAMFEAMVYGNSTIDTMTIEDIERGYPWIKAAPDWNKENKKEKKQMIYRNPMQWLEDTLEDIQSRPADWSEEEHRIIRAELNSLRNLIADGRKPRAPKAGKKLAKTRGRY
jgi:hypothetical protein